MFKLFNNAMKKKNNKGFGLIEVLVSVAILSILTLPIANSFITASNVNQKSEIKLAAMTVAENTMERAKALDLSEYEKSDDGKYYIKDDFVVENGNEFNVRTIIDPTKYADLNSRIYDLSTIDIPVTGKFTLPDDFLDQMNNQHRYKIIINIIKTELGELINVRVDVTYQKLAKNGTLLSSTTSTIYNYTGEDDGLRHLEINYKEQHKDMMDRILIINKDNALVYLTLNKLDMNNQGNDKVDIFEFRDPDTDIPYTRFTTNSYEKLALTYYTFTDTSYIDYIKDNALVPNAYYDFNGSSYSVDSKEVMHAVNVSVFKYTSNADEGIKYSDDNLVTSLDGSKLIDE